MVVCTCPSYGCRKALSQQLFFNWERVQCTNASYYSEIFKYLSTFNGFSIMTRSNNMIGLLLEKWSKLTCLCHGGNDITSTYKLSVGEDLRECGPIAVALQRLPQPIVVLLVQHINRFVVDAVSLQYSDHPLRETTERSTPWSFDECNYLLFLHEPIDELLQRDSQLNVATRHQS